MRSRSRSVAQRTCSTRAANLKNRLQCMFIIQCFYCINSVQCFKLLIIRTTRYKLSCRRETARRSIVLWSPSVPIARAKTIIVIEVFLRLPALASAIFLKLFPNDVGLAFQPQQKFCYVDFRKVPPKTNKGQKQIWTTFCVPSLRSAMVQPIANPKHNYKSICITSARQCNTGRPTERFLSDFFIQNQVMGGCPRSVPSRQTLLL